MACLPAAMAAAPLRTSAAVFGIARTTGRSGAAVSRVSRVTPAAIDRTERLLRERGRALLERGDDVARLHRHDDESGVGHRPRRARHDADPGEALLEHAPPVGIDLGDRDALGLPAGVEQPGEQRLAHAPTAQQRNRGHAHQRNPVPASRPT